MEPHLDELRAEARYWRERCELYRAKAYGARPTTPGRLRELERTALGAEARLERAEARARLGL
jgi:hypothetical protein